MSRKIASNSEQSLNPVVASIRRGHRRLTFAALAVAAALAVGTVGWVLYVRITGGTHVLETSYAFDVTNPRYVAGYADNVFVGRVEQVVETQAERDRTLYRVRIEEVYKGGARGTVIVRQLGFRDGGDVFVPGDQPLLEPGKRYLLATTKADQGHQTAIAGPEAVKEVTDSNRAAVQQRWTDAVRTERYPPGVPR